jgi:hypothetical protein
MGMQLSVFIAGCRDLSLKVSPHLLRPTAHSANWMRLQFSQWSTVQREICGSRSRLSERAHVSGERAQNIFAVAKFIQQTLHHRMPRLLAGIRVSVRKRRHDCSQECWCDIRMRVSPRQEHVLRKRHSGRVRVLIAEGIFAADHVFETPGIFTIRNVRRHLVWALGKIAFRFDTFDRGAAMLLRLAVAENEQWRNNATGQYTDLFPVLEGGGHSA